MNPARGTVKSIITVREKNGTNQTLIRSGHSSSGPLLLENTLFTTLKWLRSSPTELKNELSFHKEYLQLFTDLALMGDWPEGSHL